MPKRFRVALSFPGEHRQRVEKIAELLGAKLGREAVLYDRWYDAEFARPNLDEYLGKLYLQESDQIVVFLCKEYDEKKWCGLESRAWRELRFDGNDEMIMFLRLDEAEVHGVSKLDGFLGIRDLTDAEVAAKILKRLFGPDIVVEHRTFTSKLPVVNSLLIGRERELDFLDSAWANPETNFVQIIAAGGTGKTALVVKWLRHHVGEATIFGWSFYSQGSSPDRQTSSDLFFAEIISWLDMQIASTASIYARAEAVANRLRQERMVLLLDGVEPLQDSAGNLQDMQLKALLQELETENRGLVVCTTRVRIDLPDDAPRVLSINLDNLTAEQGAEYLRSLKVQRDDEELRQASSEYWNHPLALTLLGTYLVDFCDADIRRRNEIPRLSDVNAHAHRVIAAYERTFAGKPELDVLRALGYFDRPAEPAALKLVLPVMDGRKHGAALKRLYDARLILSKDPTKPIDCHPLVREYFAASAAADGHSRLYEYYRREAPELPDTLEEMTPLFYAVYHGCRAGLHAECYRDVYWRRIRRGDQAYLIHKLGALGTDLALLANFFDFPWSQPTTALSTSARARLLNSVAVDLRAVGRLSDAVEPARAAAGLAVPREYWKHLATGFDNLSELLLALGDITGAVRAARKSVEFANKSGDEFERMASRTTLADALHQAGELAATQNLFEESEQIEAGNHPDYPILDSVAGYQYCDLLLSQGKAEEVLRRAAETLMRSAGWYSLLSIGLDNLSLGRAHPRDSAESNCRLDQAVEFIRRSGRLDYLPRALLARGTEHDLEEVRKNATRSGMRLFLADYHLAKGNIEEAEKLINETGYHRRDKELANLKAKKATA